jgi:hypothetical protein
MVNEKHCVGAFDIAKSLCKTTNFLTIGLLPSEGAFLAFAEFQKIGEAAGVWVECITMEGGVDEVIGLRVGR